MAREKDTPRRASVKPSESEGGAGFGFPAGSTVTITEASWVDAEEIGERYVARGRQPEDPTLKLVGEIEGVDDPAEEALGGGKGTRLRASKDGDHLDIPEGSTATALNNNCNAAIFLKSIFWDGKDKKADAYARHKSKALAESLMDDGISGGLVGLKFVVGREVVERNFGDDGSDRKPRPTLVCDEILEPPNGAGGGAGKKAGAGKKVASKSKKDEDEDDDVDEAPAKSKKAKGGDDDGAEAAAEKAVVEALELPKYRKGLPVDKAFSAVYALVKGNDNQKEVTALVEDEAWLKHKDRPWSHDKEEDVLLSVD